MASHVSHFIVQTPLETQRRTYMWMVRGRTGSGGRGGGVWYRQGGRDAEVVAIPPQEGGWLERRMKRRMEGSLRALGSHTYINVACQAYRATL